ncbi:MAG: glycosyltransferase family 4 protein [Alphaproteobacteria bacterium]
MPRRSYNPAMDWSWYLLLVPAAGVASWLAVGRVLAWLRRRAIMDRPNARSSHTVPVPRGGGIGLMLALLPALAILWIGRDPAAWGGYAVVVAAAILAAVSWLDDTRTLSAWPRLAAHILAAAIAVMSLPAGALVAQGLLPLWADRIAAGLAVVYFINIFNFMDGIDGISGVETLSIGIGTALTAWVFGPVGSEPLEGLILAAAALGWLAWNWHPARLFLGDVGSVPLGFLLGWMLVRLAADGAWVAALVLPAYYLTDATLTLARRTLRGEKPWQAHREHAYQRAHQRGLDHARVCVLILGCNAGLVGLALAGEAVHWAIGIAGAALLGLGFTIYLRSLRVSAARRAA